MIFFSIILPTYNDLENLKKIEGLNLTSIVTLGSNSFKNCINLEEINLSSIENLENGAFNECNSLKSIDTITTDINGSEVYQNNLSSISEFVPRSA